MVTLKISSLILPRRKGEVELLLQKVAEKTDEFETEKHPEFTL